MSTARERTAAALFFALGDPTRLSVVRKLGARGARSATELASGAKVSRQAITKHLQVLEGAGLVTHTQRGRDVVYSLEARRLALAHAYLDAVSQGWDRAVDRLRSLVED